MWIKIALILLIGFGSSYSQFIACELREEFQALVGEELTLEVNCEPTPGSTYEYMWESGDSSTSGWIVEPTWKHTFKNPGEYTILLKVKVNGYYHFLNTFNSIVSVSRPLTPSSPLRSTTILYSKASNRVWNVNPDNHSISAIDGSTLEKLQEVKVGRSPQTLALGKGGRIYVALKDDHALAEVDPATSTVQKIKLPYGSNPYGVVVDSVANLAYVTFDGLGELAKIDLQQRVVLQKTKVFHRIRSLAMDHSREFIYTNRFITPVDFSLPRDSAVGLVAKVNAEDLSIVKMIRLTYDHSQDSEIGGEGVVNLLRSISIHPDGETAWITATKSNVFRGLVRNGVLPSHENAVRAALIVLDLEKGEEIVDLRRDFNDRGIINASTFMASGRVGFVSTQGTNSVEAVSGHQINILASIGPFENGLELAPDGLVVSPDDSKLFIHFLTTRTVGVYDVSKVVSEQLIEHTKTIKVVEQESLSFQELMGKQLFYNSEDKRMTHMGYISCASCHLEGGSDGMVWDFTDRGEGLRKTIPMLGRGGNRHGPIHWSANFDEIQDFEHDMRGPFGGEGFLPDEVFNSGTMNTTLGDKKAGKSELLDAMAAYAATLVRFDESPHRREDGRLTEAGKAGKEIFYRESVGCASCHSGKNFTDSDLMASPYNLHDVGTVDSLAGKRMGGDLPGFDTPTLLGVWKYPPYLHDGSAQTLMDVISIKNMGDKHGRTSHLSPEEKEQLVAFLQQLDNAGDSEEPVNIGKNHALFSLGQKFSPNPFRQRTSIQLDPQNNQSIFEYSIYNNSGQFILRGVHVPSQGQSISWNGVDVNGHQVKHGIYYVKLVELGKDKRMLRESVQKLAYIQ